MNWSLLLSHLIWLGRSIVNELKPKSKVIPVNTTSFIYLFFLAFICDLNENWIGKSACTSLTLPLSRDWGFLSKEAVLPIELKALAKLVFPLSTCPSMPTLKLSIDIFHERKRMKTRHKSFFQNRCRRLKVSAATPMRWASQFRSSVSRIVFTNFLPFNS